MADFARVKQNEGKLINARRRRLGVATPKTPEGQPRDLFGLALSGGGIRAAAFSMGAMESLREHQLMRHVDYLSSVSGGGFAAATLYSSSIPKPPPPANGAPREPGLESEVLARIRRWASYLAPQGLFSQSGAALMCTYVFGLVLNLAFYACALGAVTSLFVAATHDSVGWRLPVVLLGGLFGVTVFLMAAPIPGSEKGRLSERAWQRWLLYGLFSAAAFALLYLGFGAAMDRIWRNSTHLSKLAGTGAVWCIGAVPTLVKQVFSAIHDPKTLRRIAPIAIQLLAISIVLAGVILHMCICVLVDQKLFPDELDDVMVFRMMVGGWVVLAGAIFAIRKLLVYQHVSMHYFFRDRIAEAFVLESTWNRDARISDLEPNPDLKIGALATSYLPYPIINATMNIGVERGNNSTASQRRAVPFEISPLAVGFDEHYRPGRKYIGGMPLAMATAISAAAIAPRMGRYTTGLLPLLMSMFNLRLGVRLPNPADDNKRWSRRQRSLRPSPALSRYAVDSKDCYLTDGGHFDNTGIYALLRRRCRFILALDAEADPEFSFGGLGTLSEAARIDLNAHLEIDVSSLRPTADGVSAATCAIGRVTYPDEDTPPSVLVYLKAGMAEGLPPDIVAYRARHEKFPHEGTGNQFFDELQFEAYRRLGYELMQRALSSHDKAADFQGLSRLFVNMQDDLAAMPTASMETFEGTTTQFIELETAAFENEVSEGYDREVYPEVLGKDPLERKDVHYILAQIQLMEQVYLGCKLERTHARPVNAGWIRLFERYAASDTFKRVWVQLGDVYGAAFLRFCEQRFGLPLPAKSRHGNVMSLVASPLHFEAGVSWGSPGPNVVRYELAIERLVDGAWVKHRTRSLTVPMWHPESNDEGTLRLRVRALDAAAHEQALGELTTTTFKTSSSRMAKTKRLAIGFHPIAGSAFCRNKEDGGLEGFDVDLATALAEAFACALVPVRLEWPEILAAPRRQHVDLIIGSIAAREDRATAYGLVFSTPYHTTKTVMVVREPEPKAPRLTLEATIRAMGATPLRTGAQAETIAIAHARHQSLPLEYEASSHVELVEAWNERSINAVLCDEALANNFAGGCLPSPVGEPQEFCIAALAENSLLIREVNERLAARVGDLRRRWNLGP